MRAIFVNEKFKEESDPIKDMEIGKIADDRRKVRSQEWNITNNFINKILSEDFGYDEYMGYAILTYFVGNRWWSITSWKAGRNLISSSGGKSSLTKESALKDIMRKIRIKKIT